MLEVAFDGLVWIVGRIVMDVVTVIHPISRKLDLITQKGRFTSYATPQSNERNLLQGNILGMESLTRWP
jgi:hypothetical protein